MLVVGIPCSVTSVHCHLASEKSLIQVEVVGEIVERAKTHFGSCSRSRFRLPSFIAPFSSLSYSQPLVTMSEADGSAASDQIEVDAAPAPTSGSPADFLKSVVGHMVSVRLNSGVDYRGTL